MARTTKVAPQQGTAFVAAAAAAGASKDEEEDAWGGPLRPAEAAFLADWASANYRTREAARGMRFGPPASGAECEATADDAAASFTDFCKRLARRARAVEIEMARADLSYEAACAVCL